MMYGFESSLDNTAFMVDPQEGKLSMMETSRSIVYPHQIDHMDHMNVMWYTAMFDASTWHLLSAAGFTSDYIRTHQRGMVAVENTTRYKAEALAGDLLVINSTILEVRNKALRFIHVMYNAESGLELATSEFVGVHIDRARRKSCAIPADIREQCLSLMREATAKADPDTP